MSEKRSGGRFEHNKTTETWKAFLSTFLSIVLILQSTNIPAIADALGDVTAPIEAAEVEGSTDEVDDQSSTETGDEPDNTPDGAPDDVTGDVPAGDPADDPADAENGTAATVTLGVDIKGATLEYEQDGEKKTSTSEDSTIVVPASDDLTFGVTPDEGMELVSVAYGDMSLAANDNGKYVVTAADLAGGATIRVVTEEAAAEEEGEAEEGANSDEGTEKEGDESSEDDLENEGTSDEETTPDSDEEEPSEDTEEDEEGESEDTEGDVEITEGEEVVADVSSPAFEGSTFVGNVEVKVTAGEGVLPEGTTVEATLVECADIEAAVEAAIEQQGAVMESSLAIDVTLRDANGEVIQPAAPVNICFFNTELSGSEIGV